MSEDLISEMAREYPELLIDLVADGDLQPHDLTVAAEYLGKVRSSRAAGTLSRLLDHDSAVVREGAVYGLAGHLSPLVADRLRGVVSTDASPTVRDAARDVLECDE